MTKIQRKFSKVNSTALLLLLAIGLFPGCGKNPETTETQAMVVEEASAEEVAALDSHSLLANLGDPADEREISTADIDHGNGNVTFEAALKASGPKAKKKEICEKSKSKSMANVTGRCAKSGGSAGSVKVYGCKCSGSKTITCKSPVAVPCALPMEEL